MSRSDRADGRQVWFRLGFVVVLVAGAMGFTVGSKSTGPAHVRIYGETVAIPPGLGLALAAMIVAASVLATLIAVSFLRSRAGESTTDWR